MNNKERVFKILREYKEEEKRKKSVDIIIEMNKKIDLLLLDNYLLNSKIKELSLKFDKLENKQ
jgi:hypothetical protein